MIVAVAGQKGGVGKSTVAITLAVEWHRRGDRVLLVDLDQQRSAAKWAERATRKGHQIPTVVSMGEGFSETNQLPELALNYDITIIDCPGHGNMLHSKAIAFADLALFPCSPSQADLDALTASLAEVEAARAFRPDVASAIVINKKDTRTALGRSVRTALEGSGHRVLHTELGYRVAYTETFSVGDGVSRYQPRSAAAREARKLADELAELPEFANVA